MKVDVTKEILQLDGTAVTNLDGSPLILRSVIVSGLVNPIQSLDMNLDAVKKVELFTLAQKVTASDQVELTVDELALIRKRIAAVQPPISYVIVGRALGLLSGEV
jgi:hypothetical protein